jgi:uncharacterized protein
MVDNQLMGNIITPFVSSGGNMIISLVRLPSDGLRFQHQYEARELDLSERGFEFEQPPLITGRVDRVGIEMRVRGEIKAALVVPCDRCVNDVHLPLEIPFDLLYTPQQDSNQTGEIELHDRDLDVAFYDNEEIDLDELVLEQLELSLPIRVLCREDCRGLCSECGADLNVEQCQCEKPIDPRWQALADLKAQQEDVR